MSNPEPLPLWHADDKDLHYQWAFDRGVQADDVDVLLFLYRFRGTPGERVLVVGAHDEPTANILADGGYRVTGVDLRPYDERLGPCKYTHVVGDLLHPARARDLHRAGGDFDIAIALSCIEHFGMNSYGERKLDRFADVKAIHTVGQLLKPGGRAYVSVPAGSHFQEFWGHWRVYDIDSIRHRVVDGGGFRLQNMTFATAEELQVDGRARKARSLVSEAEAFRQAGIPPHVSVFLELVKGGR